MDNLQNDWQNAVINRHGDPDLDIIVNRRRTTALQSLAKRYRIFSAISAIAIIFIPFVFMRIPTDTAASWATGIFTGIYFLTASVMDSWLASGVSSIDCSTMSVSEVIRRAMLYRKRHLQFMMVLIPMAVILIGGLIYITLNDLSVIDGADRRYFLFGIVCGALAGVAIGIGQFMQFMRSYRDLK